MSYKAIIKKEINSNGECLGTFEKREKAVDELIRYGDKNISYCLDCKEDRINALQLRNWYVCGCGPYEMIIEEVE